MSCLIFTLRKISRGRGFTLVELLIVVAVLVMLGMSFMPSLEHLRAKAAQARCAANLRLLGTAWNMYADDHAGWFLPALLPKEKFLLPENYPASAAQAGDWWSKLAKDYVPPEFLQGKRNVFACPSDDKPAKTSMETNEIFHSYGYMDYFGYPYQSNPKWFACKSYGLHRRKDMKKPGATPVLTESIVTYTPTVVPAGAYGTALSKWMAFRHQGACNVLFDDGHIEAVATNDPVCSSTVGTYF